MLKTRPIDGKDSKLVQVTTDGGNIPIKDEVWAERWSTITPSMRDEFAAVYDFEVKTDDVFLVTFPKCGTTWIQELSWLLINNFDYNTAKAIHLFDRSVYLEYGSLNTNSRVNTVEKAANLKSPRLIKSHLPINLIPHQIWDKKIKVIYCARNPKDALVSYYHFLHGMGEFTGSLDEFLEDFITDEMVYTPIWWHFSGFWKVRNEPNVFFTTYEEMKRDLRGVIKKLNAFLERPDLKEPQMAELMEHLSFESMKANESINPTARIKLGLGYSKVSSDFQFMRRGIVGSNKDELTSENQDRLNQWIEKNLKTYSLTLEDIFGDVSK